MDNEGQLLPKRADQYNVHNTSGLKGLGSRNQHQFVISWGCIRILRSAEWERTMREYRVGR